MTQEPKSPSKTAAFQRLLAQLAGIVQAVVTAIAKFVGNFWWNTILPLIQGLLPAPWNRRLSKPILTGIAIALLTLILWLTSTLNRPAVSSTRESPGSPIAERPAASPPIARPEPVSAEKLARIQEKLAQTAAPYGETLIAAVQPKIHHHLILTLDDRWYRLPVESQDQFVRDLWNRSRQLDYAQLELLDLEDQRIARSPVVGEQMLILKRTSPRAAIAPEPVIEPVEPIDQPAVASPIEPVEPTAAPTIEPALEAIVEPVPNPVAQTEPAANFELPEA